MKSRWVVGGGACCDQVHAAWKQMYPDADVHKLEMRQDDNYNFDLCELDQIDPLTSVVFVAFDERFGNFKRMELMQAAQARGFKLEAFVSPSAIVAPSVIIGPNVFIGEGVVLGMDCRVDFNTVLRDGVKLGASVRLHSSCWLEAGVLVGDGADIGAHTIVRMGAVVGPSINVGKHCELGWVRRYDNHVPAKTIYDARYDEPIVVYGE